MYTLSSEFFTNRLEQSVSLLPNTEEVATLQLLLATLQQHDNDTNEHAHRMVHWAVATAQHLRLSEQEIQRLRLATVLHDIGKIEIPLTILRKADSLTRDEWNVVRSHAEAGYRILHNLGGIFTAIAPLVLTHHERWNGSGYPLGLHTDEIPFASRILAVVDSFDAMTAVRPYKDARTYADACVELKRCAGVLYDPRVVKSFLAVLHAHPVFVEIASATSTALAAA